MITSAEKTELEGLRKNPLVKLGEKMTWIKLDKERQELILLRYLYQRGIEFFVKQNRRNMMNGCKTKD